MAFAGMQSANAQNWTIRVQWTDNCGGCPTVGGYEYYVCLQIDDTCRHTTVYNQNCVIVPSSGNQYYDFNVGAICSLDEHRDCMKISYAVIKRCIISQATICSSAHITYKRCEEIYNGFTINVSLN